MMPTQTVTVEDCPRKHASGLTHRVGVMRCDCGKVQISANGRYAESERVAHAETHLNLGT